MKTTEIQLERMQMEDYLTRLKSLGNLKKVRAYLQNLVKQEERQIKGCPGRVSVEELDEILDKAEDAFNQGVYITNEEAMKQIHSW